jgi:hypothetical protein
MKFKQICEKDGPTHNPKFKEKYLRTTCLILSMVSGDSPPFPQFVGGQSGKNSIFILG